MSDQIRVVDIFQDNFRLDPDTGAVVSADTALSVIFVSGIAYDRNAPGLGATTLFGINAGSSDSLVRIGGVDGVPSPNGGVVTPIGSLGVDTSVLVGFDIAAPEQGGRALAALFVSMVGTSNLYEINLSTGQATLIGTIGTGRPTVDSLAIAPAQLAKPVPTVSPLGLIATIVFLAGLGAVHLTRRRRRSAEAVRA